MTDLSPDQQIEQLNQAKQLVVNDASLYPQIIKGILPIAVKPDRRLRRWCAEFLESGFESQQLKLNEREALAVVCLDTIKLLLEDNDPILRRHIIHCSSLIYPLVFKHMCSNKSDRDVWHSLLELKSRILQIWEESAIGMKIICIKFVQRVVAVQTPGTKDPRLADSNDISLTNVPLNHTLLSLTTLEAEAHAYLDRVLSVFYDEQTNESIISATLYSVGVLMRSRSSIVNKILSRILAFDPLTAGYDTTEPSKLRLQIRFIEKNLRILLGNLLKVSSISSHYGPRIQQYLSQLVQAKVLSAEDIMRKRGNEGEELEGSKRQRLENLLPLTSTPSEDQMSYADLFTLISPEHPLAQFDATVLASEVAVEIILAALSSTKQKNIEAAIRSVQLRYSKLYPAPRVIKTLEDPETADLYSFFMTPKPENEVVAAENEDEEDDDYEPEFDPISTATTPIPAVLDAISAPRIKEELYLKREEEEDYDDDYSPEMLEDQLQPVIMPPKRIESGQTDLNAEYLEYSDDTQSFSLPPPRPLSAEQRLETFQLVVERIFQGAKKIEKNIFSDSTSIEGKNLGELNKVPIGGDLWVILLTRLGTRGVSTFKLSDMSEDEIQSLSQDMAELIRAKLYSYVMADFRQRLDVAIMWLNEEWYNDKMLRLKDNTDFVKSEPGALSLLDTKDSSYVKWTMKLIDNLIPFLDVKDKVFLRFLSDLPELSQDMLSKLRILCSDPSRSQLGLLALRYLIKFRPPVKSYCESILEEYKEVTPGSV
ncbi:uncharacterized protein V1516DRAFT_675702 [Lipomyces oligophaga]|uniref:uncharacterized protein n=1 Tax=Lipomyces oligophaga TaxID=45792 RepID=UPI0034CD96E2